MNSCAILKKAEKKISKFNKIGVHYEAVYHYVIRKREKTKGIYTKSFLDDITAGLISFDMQRMMGDKKYSAEGDESYSTFLMAALEPYKKTLSHLRSATLQNINLDNEKATSNIAAMFDDLAKPGENGLNQREKKGIKNERFRVGVTKILHFLIPDLFIIVDKNARDELKKYYNLPIPKGGIDGTLYIKTMKIYQSELQRWAVAKKDPQWKKLIGIDGSWESFGGIRTTPIPRIMDKCTFIGKDF